jgi:hypothetical protein
MYEFWQGFHQKLISRELESFLPEASRPSTGIIILGADSGEGGQ